MKLFLFFLVVVFSFPFIVFGVTIVDDVQVDTVWTIQDSPYLLNDPFIIYPGATLTINPGVVIKMRSGGVFVIRGGNLIAKGTVDQPIYLTSEKDDSIFGDTNLDGNSTVPGKGEWSGIEIESGSKVDLENIFIRYTGGVQFIQPTILNDGTLNISSSTLSDGVVAVHNRLGNSSLHNLDLVRHDTGILSTGGNVSIQYSNIETANVGVVNQSPQVISATHNWWNDVSGPFHPQLNSGGIGVAADDNVNFIPWLSSRYGSSSLPVLCCSSVLFLPGFMASDLFVQGALSENQLWPPTSLLQQDVDKLRFDSQGNPITPGIYTKNIIEEAFGVNIYKSFADKLRSLVQVQDIEEWVPFPYDWRRDLPEIVNNFTLVKVGNNFENKKLFDEAVALAQRSPTGKITIIGHSNGGLVGKYLIRELVNQGKGGLVDQFIMVATPQLGTPKAIAGLLHGDGQNILTRLVMNNMSARFLGMNMQSAHNLFPISSYFQSGTSSVVDFNSSIRNVFDYTLYNLPQTIFSYDHLLAFSTLSDRGSATSTPTDIPATLRQDLLDNANANVGNLASWAIPSSIKLHQLIGVGQQTISGIEYKAKEEFDCRTQSGLYICDTEHLWDRILNTSFDGDGTVMNQSAEFSNLGSPNTYFLDLFSANKNLLVGGWRHDNLLENPGLQELLESVILMEDNHPLPQNISKTKPNLPNSYQQISIHSPVSLTVSDQNGNLVGRDTARQSGDFVFIREDIPNSSYMEINDQKYINLPIGAPYTINLQGEGLGTFTLNIDQYRNGSVAHQSFVDIPVSTSMKGRLDINQDNTVGDVAIDTEGDGIVDVTLPPQNTFDAHAYLAMLKALVKDFDLKESQENKILKEFDSIEEFIKKGRGEKAQQKIKKYVKSLNERLNKEKDRSGFDISEIQLLIMYLEKLRVNLLMA